MKFPQVQTLESVALLLGCDFVGEASFPVYGMNEIHVVEPGDIVFVDHPKYYDKALQSAATIILINKAVDCPHGKALLVTDDPFRDFNKLAQHFTPFTRAEKTIADSAQIGEGTIVQPGAFIGNRVRIGKNCTIHANVAIYDDCQIGDHVTIHAGASIGANAFYYKKRPEGYDRLLSSGTVVIEDHVDIGALCTIDRGVTSQTRIGRGTKMDNQVHVGHDTVIGQNCLLAAQIGIAGCVIIEDEVTIWGQVGIRSGITIGAKAVVNGQSGVTNSLAGGKQYWGTPAQESREMLKQMAALKKFPDIIDKLK